MLGNAPMFTISIFKITKTLTDEVRLELFIFLFFFFGLNILFPGREISCIFNNAFLNVSTSDKRRRKNTHPKP